MRNLFLALATIFIYSTASAQNTIQEIIKKVENVKVVYKLDNAGGGEFDFQNTYKELVFYGYTKNGGGTMMLALQVDAKNNQAYKEMFDLCHKYLLLVLNDPDTFSIQIIGGAASGNWTFIKNNSLGGGNQNFSCDLIRDDAKNILTE